MLLPEASNHWYSVEKPKYGLPSVPFCTVRVEPLKGFLRPSGSAMVAPVLMFCASCALMRPGFFGFSSEGYPLAD